MKLFRRLLGTAKLADGPPALPKFDYELINVHGKDAVRRALELRRQWGNSFTPIILGTHKDFRLLTDIWDEVGFPRPEEYLRSAAQLDLAKWLCDQSHESCGGDPEGEISIREPSDWDRYRGSAADFATVRDGPTEKLHPWVLIAKIPTPHPYEVPAFLKFGGWNECPEAPVHVALWSKWQNEHDARILCVTGDVMEATVARPPVNKEDCYKLAHEQYCYCRDIVTQGLGSIDALAATLREGKTWYFWWD